MQWPKTGGGIVRRSRRSQGLEAETEFIEITRKSTKIRKLNKGKEGVDEVPTKFSQDVMQKEVPEFNEEDGDGDEVPKVEIEKDETLPHSIEGENVIAEERSTEAENGIAEEQSQPTENENGVTHQRIFLAERS